MKVETGTVKVVRTKEETEKILERERSSRQAFDRMNIKLHTPGPKDGTPCTY